MQHRLQIVGNKIVALGAGRMGRSIALAYALRGQDIIIIDFKERTNDTFNTLKHEIELEIDETLSSLVEIGMIPNDQKKCISDRISILPINQAEQALAQAYLVFEGVPETSDAKQDALTRLSTITSEHVVIASTTSTMLTEELSYYVKHPERFLNAHWLNPAFLVPLVEISTHKTTSDVALQVLQDSLTAVGKVAVLCQGAGFIVPRLQALIMNEAARMVEEGVASAEDIDLATRYGLGFRFAAVGLLEFIDFGGADILYYANEYLAKNIDASRYDCPEIIKKKMQTGQLGLKSGKGFFLYENGHVAKARGDILIRNFEMLRHFGLAPSYE